MKNIIQLLGLTFLLIIMPFLPRAQNSPLEKANEYYGFMGYGLAIPLYEQVLEKDSSNSDVLFKLADCYRLSNNNPKALAAYAKVIKLPDAKPLHKYLYAQALMMAGKYSEAKTYMNAYAADERGKIFAKSCEDISQFYKYARYTKIRKMPYNSPQNDFSPAIWKNNTVVFSSSRERTQVVSYRNAWTGDRYDALFSAKLNVVGESYNVHFFNDNIQTRYNNGSPCFSNDGKYIYFTRNNIIDNEDIRGTDGVVHLKIFRATLDDKNEFGDVKEFKFNSNNYNCTHPAMNSNGTMLFFASDMPGGYGGMDIWVSIKKDTTWGQPINLGSKVNSAGNEVFPYIRNDKTLYYASNGLEGLGGLDIFSVEVGADGMPKVNSQNIGAPINSMADDFGIVFYPGADSGYFSSNFGNVNNDDDIFAFVTRPVKHITIQGTVTEYYSKELIPGAKVTLTNATGSVNESALADENGKFSFVGDYSTDYILNAEKEGYPNALPFNLSTPISEATPDITANLTLKKKPAKLLVHVYDAIDNTPLEAVNISMLDKASDKTESFYTASTGDCSFDLIGKKTGDSLTYKLTLTKSPYTDKVVNWKEKINKPSDTALSFSVGMTKKTVEGYITLNPIYFDFNKYNISSDAALELDKVVEFMKSHPEIKIELGSYTDCRGDAASNQVLSDNRATASMNYIVSKGISKDRITARGYGETKLVNSCACEGTIVSPCTEEEHALNRRTEFVIVGE